MLKRKELAEGRDITLLEVEDKTKISRKTLQAWRDNNIKRFDKDVLEKLCAYLDCDPCDLIVLVQGDDHSED